MNDINSQRPDDRNAWFWFVVSIPLLTVFAGITTVFIAFSDVDGLVSDDYYKDGLSINQNLHRDALARHLNIHATVTIHAIPPENARINITLRAADPMQMPGTMQLQLAHSTRAQYDHDLILQAHSQRQAFVSQQSYSATLPELAQGAWWVTLETTQWRLKKRVTTPFPRQFVIP